MSEVLLNNMTNEELRDCHFLASQQEQQLIGRILEARSNSQHPEMVRVYNV